MGFRQFYIKTVVTDILFMPATTVSFYFIGNSKGTSYEIKGTAYFFISGREKINSVPTPSVLITLIFSLCA